MVTAPGGGNVIRKTHLPSNRSVVSVLGTSFLPTGSSQHHTAPGGMNFITEAILHLGAKNGQPQLARNSYTARGQGFRTMLPTLTPSSAQSSWLKSGGKYSLFGTARLHFSIHPLFCSICPKTELPSNYRISVGIP